MAKAQDLTQAVWQAFENAAPIDNLPTIESVLSGYINGRIKEAEELTVPDPFITSSEGIRRHTINDALAALKQGRQKIKGYAFHDEVVSYLRQQSSSREAERNLRIAFKSNK